MKVLNLRCSRQHDFEGWFASEDDFAEQGQRGVLTCPLCGDPGVQKMPSAPRLNLRATPDTGSPESPTSSPPDAGPGSPQAQAQLLRAMREVLAQTEDVGEHFAQQARAMHHGDIASRHIRGRTSVQEAVALLEEGVEILPLPDLPGLKTPLQ